MRSWEGRGPHIVCGAVYMSRCMQESRAESQESEIPHKTINPLVINAPQPKMRHRSQW